MRSSTNPLRAACPKCGADTPEVEGLGLFLIIDEYEVAHVEGYLTRREADNLPCNACGTPLGRGATVVFFGREPALLAVVPGPLLAQDQKAVEVAAHSLGAQVPSIAQLPKFPPIQLLESPSQLRGLILARVLRHAKLIEQFVQAHREDSATKFIVSNIDHLDVPFFAAARLSCLLPELGWTGSGRLELFGNLQGQTWPLLFGVLVNDNRPLEEALSRYVCRQVVLPGAVAEATDRLCFFLSRHDNLSPRTLYVMDALCASLHAADGTTYNRAGMWAKRFFTVELGFRLGENSSRQELQPLLISAQRARETISFLSAWDAYQSLLMPIDASYAARRQALEEICEKAGHPDLPRQVDTHLNRPGAILNWTWKR